MAWKQLDFLLSPQLDLNGDILVGGQVYFYIAGTSTPVTVDLIGNGSSLVQSATLDSGGRLAVWADGNNKIKVVLMDVNSVIIKTIDNLEYIPAETPTGALLIDGSNNMAADLNMDGFNIDNVTDVNIGSAGAVIVDHGGTINRNVLDSILLNDSTGQWSIRGGANFSIVQNNVSDRFYVDSNYGTQVISPSGVTASYLAIRTATGNLSTNSLSFTHNDSDGTYGDRSFIENTKTTGELAIKTKGLERINIKNDGRIGIGETDPDTLLHLKNAQDTILKIEKTSGAEILIGTSSTAGYIGTINNTPLYFQTANDVKAVIDIDGNLGIGCTPENKLMVYGSSDNEIAKFYSTPDYKYITVGNGTPKAACIGFQDSINTAVFNISGSSPLDGISLNNLNFVGIGSGDIGSISNLDLDLHRNNVNKLSLQNTKNISLNNEFVTGDGSSGVLKTIGLNNSAGNTLPAIRYSENEQYFKIGHTDVDITLTNNTTVNGNLTATGYISGASSITSAALTVNGNIMTTGSLNISGSLDVDGTVYVNSNNIYLGDTTTTADKNIKVNNSLGASLNLISYKESTTTFEVGNNVNDIQLNTTNLKFNSGSINIKDSSGDDVISYVHDSSLTIGKTTLGTTLYATSISLNPSITGNNFFIGGTGLAQYASPGTPIHLGGGGLVFEYTSTNRNKSNIRDLEEISSNIYQLQPRSYEDKKTNNTSFGLIAEEVNEIFPNLVPKNDKGECNTVAYELLSVLLLSELKKLKTTVDLQTVMIAQLNDRLTVLESK